MDGCLRRFVGDETLPKALGCVRLPRCARICRCAFAFTLPGRQAEAPVQPPPIRHWWYDGPHGRQAASLLGWRNAGGHYDGRIAVAALEPGEG